MSGSNPNLQPLIGPKLPPSLSEGKRDAEEERNVDPRPAAVSSSNEGLGMHGMPAVVQTSRQPQTTVDQQKSAFTTPLRPTLSSRTMLPQPVHPVTSLGVAPSGSTSQSYMSKPSPMASLIRGSQHHQPCPSSTTHLTRAALAPTYSGHVPRGPAAVASITPPRAAVATPMVRPPHSQLVSSMSQAGAPTSGSLHSQMQPRPSLPTVRNLMPSVAKALPSSVPPCCISDSHRLSTLSNVATIQMATAVHADPLMRSTTLSKPVHVSQPIMQAVQQVPDKNYYKPILGNTVTGPSPSVLPVQQTLAQPLPQMITMATSQTNTLSMPVSSSSHIPLHPVPTNHAPVQPKILPHSHVASSAPQMTGLNLGSQAKLVSQTVHTVAPLPSQPPAANVTTVTGKTCISTNATTVVPASLPRQTNATSIPVAKVHPQPVPVSSRPPLESLESSAVNLLLPPAHRASPNQPTPTSVSDMPASVVLMEPQQERPPVNKNGSFTLSLQQKMVPSTTYYYEPYQNNLALSSYGSSTSSFSPICTTSTLRPGMVPSHPTPSLTATMQTASRTPGPVMVTIDPNRPLALHGSYTSPVENTISTSEPSSSGGVSSTVFTVSTSGNSSTNFIVTQPPTSNASIPAPLSSSPRPSILRKRTSEGASVVVRKNLLCVPGTEPASPHPDSNSGNSLAAATSPKPTSEALSREGGVPSLAENGDGLLTAAVPAAVTLSSMQLVTVKAEPASEAAEAGVPNAPISQPTTNLGSTIETSPRKKPRKQQLTSNELMETHSTDAEEEFEKDNKESIQKEIVREDEEGVRWVVARQRPPITLLNSYRHTWKSRHNHFLRYCDVRPKEERRPTVHDLANQKGVLQKVSGWKVHHLCTQLDEVVEMEDSVHGRLSEFLSNMEQKNVKSDEDKDMNKVNELIKGNLQRCRLIRDQMREARQQVLKVVDHKPNIAEIVTKFISKRPVKKRDRN